ncbi:hypothetical protein MES5069_510035 [Mesorhizobium escarrei]|uniref:Uncharacterized protein n=1 Tax=Mesorhizobium escarrei TaxID=666018 RepID=A0ABN8K744_9HYPH|nr:hypothetical protein MES5069_510035 [Mesorhizobium escarrei]
MKSGWRCNRTEREGENQSVHVMFSLFGAGLPAARSSSDRHQDGRDAISPASVRCLTSL